MSTTGNGAGGSVALDAQPVRLAIALVVVSVITLLLQGSLTLVTWLGAEWMQEAVLGSDPHLVVALLALVVIGIVLLVLGLALASLILSILVVVKGAGKLRIGAAVLIGASMAGLAVSFSVSGDVSQLPGAAAAASTAFTVLEAVYGVLRVLATLVGVVLLVLGIREVRRERAWAGAVRPPG